MFESTFILRFTHRDCSEIEEQEHTAASTAWEAFRAFAEPDSSEIYHRHRATGVLPGETARSARWHR